MERFEQQYPLSAREEEIKQILRFVTRGQSCELISVPGAGRSTVLRLLAYHEKLRNHHLQQSNNQTMKQLNNYLFVYVNFAELANFETIDLNKALFLAILAAIRELGPAKGPWTSMGKELYGIFKEALSLNDSLVLLQSLKRALNMLQLKGSTPIFLFDRFSEFAEKISPDFFINLKTLRVASGGKLAVVFSTHRPLEDLLPVDKWRDFYEFFVGNHIFLAMYDKAATDFRINVLEQEYGNKLSPQTKEELVRLTGGHGKLMKLSTQILLQEQNNHILRESPAKPDESRSLSTLSSRPKGSRLRSNNKNRTEGLINFLLSHILIKGSLSEIWQALTLKERKILKDYVFNNITIQQYNNPELAKLHIPFPLLFEFIRRGIAETLVAKTIRLDEKTNEISLGDEPLELTAQEFRFLSYLIKNPNRVCDRDEIINAVWTDAKTQAGVSDEALDQLIHRLRKKLEDEADNPKHLLTLTGRGFRFIP